MASYITSALCCKPFYESGRNNVRNNLRNMLPWITENLPQLNNDHKVCDKCHKKILKLKCDASNKQKDDDSDSNETEQFAKITAMQSLNESLQSIGESLGKGKYPTSKMKRIEKAVKTIILNILENVSSSAVSPLPDGEILKQLKEKFQDSVTSESLKVTILTILPECWSIRKVQVVFPGASNHMIRRAKQLVMDQGIMSSPNPKPCKSLNKVAVEVVKSFYNSDEVSRVMPSKKDYTSIQVSGVKYMNINNCWCAI
jgi:hypothetical protein